MGKRNKRLVRIGEAADLLGVDPQTLRNWDASGELVPARRTASGYRYYDRAELLGRGCSEANLTVGYARVSSHDQKADLDRQHEVLEAYCSAQGWHTEIIRDLGSGLKYDKPGLKRLTDLILRRQMGRLVLTHRDRLMRFGAELVFAMCESQGIEVVVIHQTDSPSFEEELAQDVIEIMTVFSARLYGRRSHKSRRLIEVLKSGATEADVDEVES